MSKMIKFLLNTKTFYNILILGNHTLFVTDNFRLINKYTYNYIDVSKFVPKKSTDIMYIYMSNKNPSSVINYTLGLMYTSVVLNSPR